MKTRTYQRVALAAVTAVCIATVCMTSCGSSNGPEAASPDSATAQPVDTSADGVRLVSAHDGAAIQTQPPDDLVILDVRTPEEFAEGHLEGATMIDFYADDFADRLAELDPDVPYLLYCRSGNRSGQTAEALEQLGFNDVADIDGGIVSWTEASLPIVTE